METENNKIHKETEHQPKEQDEKEAFEILENENKELLLELESKNNEIQRLKNELDKKKSFSCEYVFHTYAVYKGTDNIAFCDCRKDYMIFLPDELIVIIFSYLPQNFLHTCARVCKRWKKIYHHKSLWKEVKILDQGVHMAEINYLISLGAKKLFLSHLEVYPLEERNDIEDDEINSSEKSIFSTDKQYQLDNHNELQKLKLQFVLIRNNVLSDLLRKSTALTSLTMDRLTINSQVCKAISELIKLISLKLIFLKLSSKDLECILQGCTNLTKLDLSRTYDWISEPPSYFPPQLTKLILTDVFYGRGSNEQFKGLIQKCPNLTSLTIDHCLGLTPLSVNEISTYLKNLQYLSLRGNDRLNYNLSVLKKIPTLKEIRLSCDRNDMDPTMEDNLKNIKLTVSYLDTDFDCGNISF